MRKPKKLDRGGCPHPLPRARSPALGGVEPDDTTTTQSNLNENSPRRRLIAAARA